LAPFAVQGSRTRTGILSPSSGDRVIPVAFGVDDSRGVAGYASSEIYGVSICAVTGHIHQRRITREGIEGRAVGVVGGLREVCGGDGVTGSERRERIVHRESRPYGHVGCFT